MAHLITNVQHGLIQPSFLWVVASISAQDMSAAMVKIVLEIYVGKNCNENITPFYLIL